MTPEATVIARKLAAHERWEWDVRMAAGERVYTQTGDPYWTPNLDDWATVGVLLGMLVEAAPGAEVLDLTRQWRDGAPVWRFGYPADEHCLDYAETEGANPGEAVARALLEVLG